MDKNKKNTNIPDPNTVFPNEFGTTCFIKNVVKAPNVFIGDYTYYDSENSPEEFEKNNILFNYPIFGVQREHLSLQHYRRRLGKDRARAPG